MPNLVTNIEEELSNYPPPRKVGFRRLNGSWRDWFRYLMLFIFLLVSILGAFRLAPQLTLFLGRPEAAIVSSRFQTVIKNNMVLDHLNVYFQDSKLKINFTDVQVSPETFDKAKSGDSIAIHYLSLFPWASVADNFMPGSSAITLVGLLFPLLVFYLVGTKVAASWKEYILFENGVIAHGKMIGLSPDGRLDRMTVAYSFRGQEYKAETTVGGRKKMDEEEKLMVLLDPQKPEYQIIIFRNKTSVFKAKALNGN